MNQFCCLTCNNPLKIKNGDYLFSYNIECRNNHIRENIELEDILSTKKPTSFICESHKKKNIIHCYDCDVDICFLCYKELHNLHKMEYLKTLNYDQICRSSFESDLKEDKEYIENFIIELAHFKSQLNLFIDILKSDLKKFYKFRCDLINNISQENSPYANIENVKNLLKNKNFLEMRNFIRKFSSNNVFVKKYDNLKNIFELMFKKGKYIESQNIKNISTKNIIPLDEKYFIRWNKITFFILEKSLELNLKKYKFNNIFEKSMYFNISQIKLKSNENIKKRLSLYMLSNYNKKAFLYEVTIENLCDFNIKEILALNGHINLFILSEDKNLIDNGIKLVLYDKSFKSQNLVSFLSNNINGFLKIDSNTFIYSLEEGFNINICFVKNDKVIYQNQIFNCGHQPIYFSEKKNLIFTNDYQFIYLSNFIPSTIGLELFQKIELKDFYYHFNITELIRCVTSFNDDSIYIGIKINKNLVLVQYKIIESELVEISRIEIY